MVVCQEHKYLKRGNCPTCKACVKCPAPPYCTTKEKHKPLKETVRSRLSGSKRKERSTISSSSSFGESDNDNDDDDDDDSDGEIVLPPSIIAKETTAKIYALFDSLDLCPKELRIPKCGYDPDKLRVLGNNSRSLCNIALNKVIFKAASILCPLDPTAPLELINVNNFRPSEKKRKRISLQHKREIAAAAAAAAAAAKAAAAAAIIEQEKLEEEEEEELEEDEDEEEEEGEEDELENELLENELLEYEDEEEEEEEEEEEVDEEDLISVPASACI